MNREIIHLALAGYVSDEAVIRLAKKYIRTTHSPKVKRAMKVVLGFPLSASELAKETYWDKVEERVKPTGGDLPTI